MSNNQPGRRALVELDDFLEEVIQRNPEQYQELIDLIETKLDESQTKTKDRMLEI